MRHRGEGFHLLFESETDCTPIRRHTFFPLLSQVDVRSILFAIGGIFTDTCMRITRFLTFVICLVA